MWNALAAANRKLIETACTAGVTRNLANTEASQGSIIAGFPAIGVSAENLPIELLHRMAEVTEEILEEEANTSAQFREILESQRSFRRDYAHWKRRAYLPRDF